MTVCKILHAGVVDYAAALDWQNRLSAARGRDETPDTLLLLEHPHTYTLGSSGKREHLLLTPEECARRNIAVYNVDRGGDITYHGPGQLVGYPILRLPRTGERLRVDVIAYVRGLEQVILNLLTHYGITAYTIPGLTGVWVGSPDAPEKICAIGVRVDVKGVTKHGFALNVNTDLRYFEGIIPCGIADKGVTSMARLLEVELDLNAVAQRLIEHFGAVFAFRVRRGDPPDRPFKNIRELA